MDDVRFAHPGYSEAMSLFIHAVFRAMAGNSPILGAIRERPTRHRGPSRNVQSPRAVEHAPSTFQQKVLVPFEVVREGRVEEFVQILIDGSAQYINQLERSFFQTVTDVTQATGNVLDVKGEMLSFEHIIRMIEGLEIGNDESGNLRLPTLYISPETAKKLATMEPTTEQADRLNAILKQKHEENLRKKKVRRLGR